MTTLREYELSRIRPNAVVVMVGGRGSGKTTIAMDVARHFSWIPEVLAFAATDDSNGVISAHFPGSFVHTTFSVDVLTAFVKRQTERTAATLARYNGDSNRANNDFSDSAILLMDDMGYDARSWMTEKIMKYIFLNGRHKHILLILTLQYVMSIGPELRSQIDVVFAMADSTVTNQKRLYDHMGFGSFETFQDFRDAFHTATRDFGCLVSEMRSSQPETVFWYKSDQSSRRSDYRVGGPGIWEAHYTNVRRRQLAGATSTTQTVAVDPTTDARMVTKTRVVPRPDYLKNPASTGEFR